MCRKSSDMELVEDRFCIRDFRVYIIFPVKLLRQYPATHRFSGTFPVCPFLPACDDARIRICHNFPIYHEIVFK